MSQKMALRVMGMVVLALALLAVLQWRSGRETDQNKRSSVTADDTVYPGPPRNIIEVLSEARPGPKKRQPEAGLPILNLEARVCDLIDGEHFDMVLRDTPAELRPPSVVVFFNSSDATCAAEFKRLNVLQLAESQLPGRDALFIGQYDVYAAPRRAWYEFTPDMDLAKRMGVTACPQAVFVSRKCHGWHSFCHGQQTKKRPGRPSLPECDKPCPPPQVWDGKGDLTNWANALIEKDGPPKLSRFLRTYREQAKWLAERDTSTQLTIIRNLYVPPALAKLTPTGFTTMSTPPEITLALTEMYQKRKEKRVFEEYDGGDTLINFHEYPTFVLPLTGARNQLSQLAEQHIQPLVEQWAGIQVKLSQVHGAREYQDGARLANHVDFIGSHIIAVSVNIKLNPEQSSERPWPFEVIPHNGERVQVPHEHGTMVIYESSSVPHGRPLPNDGGSHLGCFFYFVPLLRSKEEEAAWQQTIDNTFRSMNDKFAYQPFRSMESEDPEEPSFSARPYGEHSQWKHLDTADAEVPKNNNEMLVDIKNEADRVLDVYWASSEGRVVKQATVYPSVSFQVTTFPGHRFFFAEEGSIEALPSSLQVITKGRYMYKYSKTRDGGHREPSKWAPYVKEKFEKELETETEWW